MDPSMLTLLTGAVESLINKALQYDPASKAKITTITDVLSIELSQPTMTLYCVGSDDGIRFMHYWEGPIKTTLSATPQGLLSLIKQPTNLADSNVNINGSVGLLQQWQSALQDLDIDWEDAISSIFGDIAGPMFASSIRKGAAWASTQKTENTRLLKEYLTEEVNIVPSKVELERFYRQVSDISFDTDRLEARFQQVLNTIKSKKEH